MQAAAIAVVAVAAKTQEPLRRLSGDRATHFFFAFRRRDVRPAQAESPSPCGRRVMMALGKWGKKGKTVKTVAEF